MISLIKIIKIVYNNCLKWQYFKKAISNPKEFIKGYWCIYGTFVDAVYYLKPEWLSIDTKLQLEFRHTLMDKECLDNGCCKVCGCTTTALQASKLSCEGNCYPIWIDKDLFRQMFIVNNTCLNMDTVKAFKYLWDSYIKTEYNELILKDTKDV